MMGLMIEPWGTPCVVVCGVELNWSMMTVEVERYDLNHFRAMSVTPID